MGKDLFPKLASFSKLAFYFVPTMADLDTYRLSLKGHTPPVVDPRTWYTSSRRFCRRHIAC